MMIDDFYASLRIDGALGGGPLSRGSVQRVHGVLHRALAQAMRWEWIWGNPAASASPPRLEPKEMRPPSPGDVARLLAHVAIIDPLFHLLLVLAAMTGARRGQLLALRWVDIDFERGSVSFQRALVEGPDGPVLAPTKTRRAHRVALDPATLQFLREPFGLVPRRHPDVDDHDLGTVLADECKQLRTVARLAHHFEAGAFQETRQPFPQKHVVFGEDHTRPVC